MDCMIFRSTAFSPNPPEIHAFLADHADRCEDCYRWHKEHVIPAITEWIKKHPQESNKYRICIRHYCASFIVYRFFVQNLRQICDNDCVRQWCKTIQDRILYEVVRENLIGVPQPSMSKEVIGAMNRILEEHMIAGHV